MYYKINTKQLSPQWRQNARKRLMENTFRNPKIKTEKEQTDATKQATHGEKEEKDQVL